MPITLHWADDARTILHVTCQGYWTDDDIQAIIQESTRQITQQTGPRVDTIVDLRASQRPLYTLNIARVTGDMRHMPSVTGIFVIVQKPTLSPQLINALRAFIFRGQTPIRLAHSLPEAHQIIHAARSRAG